jgi:erythrin-vacuolar iron transport family protein
MVHDELEHKFLLQRVQPAMVGLIDGSLSTIAPIFAVAIASHDTRYAFIAGLATSLGAAVSMGFSEALSDTGELTGRGSPLSRGLITGGGTFIGGILHSLPFLIADYQVALFFAIAVVGVELLTLAYLRWKFFNDTFVRALGIVTFAGMIIAGISAGLGSLLGTPGG